MSNKTVYLVSGAGRGLGFGFVKALVAGGNAIVFAGVRDIAKATELNTFAEQHPDVHVISLRSADVANNEAAAEVVTKTTGRIDVVIANAGMSDAHGPLISVPASAYARHFEVNTLGPLVLFQTCHSLLLHSKSPTFVIISSAMGSIGMFVNVQGSAYGTSKAAVNYVMRTIHEEHASEGIVTFAIHPGWVATDMGNAGAVATGLNNGTAPVSIEDSVEAVLGHIAGATRTTKGGKFLNWKSVSDGHMWSIPSEELPF